MQNNKLYRCKINISSNDKTSKVTANIDTAHLVSDTIYTSNAANNNTNWKRIKENSKLKWKIKSNVHV